MFTSKSSFTFFILLLYLKVCNQLLMDCGALRLLLCWGSGSQLAWTERLCYELSQHPPSPLMCTSGCEESGLFVDSPAHLLLSDGSIGVAVCSQLTSPSPLPPGGSGLRQLVVGKWHYVGRQPQCIMRHVVPKEHCTMQITGALGYRGHASLHTKEEKQELFPGKCGETEADQGRERDSANLLL